MFTFWFLWYCSAQTEPGHLGVRLVLKEIKKNKNNNNSNDKERDPLHMLSYV